MSYDDDRPGMMRVHIGHRRADALCEAYTRDHLRALARARGLNLSGRKWDLAWRLATFAGMTAPGYDKKEER